MKMRVSVYNRFVHWAIVARQRAALAPVDLAYETYGKLTADASNAILICCADRSMINMSPRNPLTGKDLLWVDGGTRQAGRHRSPFCHLLMSSVVVRQFRPGDGQSCH
jgi:hypothetical protein